MYSVNSVININVSCALLYSFAEINKIMTQELSGAEDCKHVNICLKNHTYLKLKKTC